MSYTLRDKNGIMVCKLSADIVHNAILPAASYTKESIKTVFTTDQCITSLCGNIKVYLWENSYIVRD